MPLEWPSCRDSSTHFLLFFIVRVDGFSKKRIAKNKLDIIVTSRRTSTSSIECPAMVFPAISPSLRGHKRAQWGPALMLMPGASIGSSVANKGGSPCWTVVDVPSSIPITSHRANSI